MSLDTKWPKALRAHRKIAKQVEAYQQDSQDGYWFGSDSPKAGVVPANDLREVARSCSHADYDDLKAFSGARFAARSTYQKVSLGHACTVGLVEVALRAAVASVTQNNTWVQVSLYEDTGGAPGALLGRCYPVPFASLHDDNTNALLLPLWVPFAHAAGALWVGFSPKAYAPPSVPGVSVTNLVDRLYARGSRETNAATPLLTVTDGALEPPLGTSTSQTDRHIWVRLYEDPETLALYRSAVGHPPSSASGVRAALSRYRTGLRESAYVAEVVPGLSTLPWYVQQGAMVTSRALTGGGTSGASSIQQQVIATTGIDPTSHAATYQLTFATGDVVLAFCRGLALIRDVDFTLGTGTAPGTDAITLTNGWETSAGDALVVVSLG